MLFHLSLLFYSNSLTSLFCFLLILITIRYLLGFVSSFPGGYGRLLPPLHNAFDENFSSPGPKRAIISTFELDGDITIAEIRNIFEERVLQAKIGTVQLRYPEFQQYITTLFGFLIWKNEDDFNIVEHVTEMEANFSSLDISHIHQTQINRSFLHQKSPWELILFRNHIPFDGSTKFYKNNEHGRKSILCFRMHHIIGDAKSIMKIFVECIGGKRLKIADSRCHEMTFVRRISFPILFPFYFFKAFGKLIYLTLKHHSHSHPWNIGLFDNKNYFVKFTKPLNINVLKVIAANNGVTVSAVVLYFVAGAMRKFHLRLTEKGVMMGYILPLEHHPNVLANHMRGIVDLLPTNEVSNLSSVSDRLRCYDSFFKSIRKLERYTPFDRYSAMFGLLPRSLLQKAFLTNYYYPVGVTNIAGEREGFSIGGAWCSGFKMSVAGLRGISGAVFCAFSYRNELRISFIGKESIASAEDAVEVVNLIGWEYDCLCKETKSCERVDDQIND